MSNLATFPTRRPAAALAAAGGLVVLAVLGILRLRGDASVENLFDRRDPAAAALGRVLHGFGATEALLVLATVPEARHATPEADAAVLLSFADRLAAAVRASPDGRAVAADVVYRADARAAEFFERVLAPAGVYYLDDAAFAAARERLTPAGMAGRLRRNEALLAAPGPGAAALAKVLLQDPLGLHEFLAPGLASPGPGGAAGRAGSLFSPDGRSLLVRVPGNGSLGDVEFAARITSVVTELARGQNTDGLEIDIAGGYAIAAASGRAIRRDMIVSVVTSVLLLQALFVIAYRRPVRSFLLAFVPVAVGIAWGFGARSLVSPTISPAAAVVGAILAGLGIDYSVLYLPHYLRSRAAGARPAAAAAGTSAALGPTLVAACVTSVLGFAAVGASGVPAMRDFALVGSLGLAGALIASLWVLPALVVLAERRSPAAADDGRAGGMAARPTPAASHPAMSAAPETSSAPEASPAPGDSAGAPRPAAAFSHPRLDVEPLLRWVDAHRWWSIGGSLVLFVVAVAIVTISVAGGRELMPLESDLTVLHPRPNVPLDAQAKISSRMGSDPGSLIVHLTAATPDALVRAAHDVGRGLRSPPARAAGVAGSFGIDTLLPDPRRVESRRAALGAGYADRVAAEFRAAVADGAFSPAAYEPYATFLRRLLDDPPAPTLDDLRSHPSLGGTVLAKATLAGATAGGPVEAVTLVFLGRPIDDRAARAAAVDAVRAAVAGIPGATLTGMSVVGFDAERSVPRDLPRLFVAAAALVAAYLAFHFRRPGDVLLACVPMVFGVACRFALLHAAGQSFNVVNLVSVPLLIGIDVDYGIFLVSVARRARAAGSRDVASPLAASCHGVIVSAASNVLGFGSLVTTSVPAIRSLGWAVGVGVATCLVATLFLLAPMLMMLAAGDAPAGRRRRSAPDDKSGEKAGRDPSPHAPRTGRRSMRTTETGGNRS